ncbi:kinesin protein KIF2A [Echinococcus multilocularis]|uniref:Kinesin protein KIF2A n=1 Tax=Echinococcus multilocularis TaxID=6211 RepID=A0A0S4MN06_ECHMU|nr:kinesin protein KIF2A [Echinococcus multilocularis]
MVIANDVMFICQSVDVYDNTI